MVRVVVLSRVAALLRLQAAIMVSRYCQKVGDFRGAIEFLLIAKRHEEAFQIAKDHDEVEMFASALGTEASEAENQRIATFYESKSNWGMVRCCVHCSLALRRLDYHCDGVTDRCRRWCGVVWCGVVWCGVVWCGVVWCGVVWCGVCACVRAGWQVLREVRPVQPSCQPVSAVWRPHAGRGHQGALRLCAVVYCDV
jgi:hypothetical protein